MSRFVRCKRCSWEGNAERLIATTTGTICPACGFPCSDNPSVFDNTMVLGSSSTGYSVRIYGLPNAYRYKARYVLRDPFGRVLRDEKVVSVDVAKKRTRKYIPNCRWNWHPIEK